MMGKNHVITSACALEHAYVANELINRADLVPLNIIRDFAAQYLGIAGLMAESSAPLYVSVLSVPLYLAAFFLGSLLPDIDNPKSMLGRYIRLPFAHRTWIHAIYLYFVFAVLGWFWPVFGWLFFGVFVHLFWDSFSAMGNCWFYKILSDYREYPGGAKVKKGHKLKLYYAGEWSEYVLVFIIVVFTAASFIWIRRM